MAKYHLRTTEKEIELPFIESGIPSIWDRLPNNTIEMEYHQQNFTKTIQPKPLTTKKFKLLSNQKLFTRNKIHFWQTKNNVTKCQCHTTNDYNTYNNKYNNNNNSSSNSIKDNRNFCFSIKSNNIIPTTSFLTSCCCCSQSIKYPKNQIEPTTSSTSSSSSYSSLSSTLQSSPLTKNPNINFIIPVNKTRISNLVMQNIINFNNKAITTILLTRLKLISLAKKRINSFNLQLYWWQQKQFLWIILFILFGLLSKCSAIRQDAAQECIFPQRWEGSWFLSGYQQSIHIKGSQFSYRGKCKASDGNKYLIVDEKGCHRCLVIYEKHKNVLQYKESECEGDSMYMDQSMNPAAMPMRSIVKSDHNRGGGGAHPNMNGHSRLSSSDQYIMRSNDDSNDCPSGFCRGREILQNLCDQIPGDALLYSLFREQAEPVKCPLKGPFTFTYNRGHGECKNPVSNIESCTDESRLLLNFQACPDVQGTESAAEELTCLATWKDGNSRYLVGLVSHHHAISNEERFRCFVYEKISSMMGAFPGSFSSPSLKDAEYKLAQSGDATCNGLDSAEVGSRIMTLRKPPPAERCDFPTWFKGPRHWHGLMAKSQYIFHPSDGSMQIKKPNGNMETRAFCEQINKQTATEMMAVVHHTTGCQSGFMCMMFYRRDTHITEIQTGTPANRLEDACAPDHFDITKLQYVTLLANNPEPQICPLDGLYALKGAIGPPHKISRHKRNHNNKGHYQHNHHHHDLLGVKRHGTFNLHISDENEQPSPSTLSSSSSSSLISSQMATIVQSNTNRLLIRNRRTVTTTPPINHNIEELSSKSILNIPLKNSINNNDGDDNNNNSNNVSSGDDVIKKFSTISSIPIIATESIDNNDHLNGNIIKESTKLKLSLKHISTNLNDVTSVSNSNKILSQPQYKMENLSSSSSLLQSIVSIKNSQSIEILNQRNRRETPGCIVNNKDQRKLWIGCTEPNIIDVRPQCNEDGDEVYYCHGSWNENGTVYIIAKHSGTQHGVCITYQLLDGKDAKLIVGDSCVRAPMKPAEHHLVANIKNIGKCGDPNSSVKYTINIFILLTAIGFTILNSKS